MRFNNIKELKRGYSASFDSLAASINKGIESHADLADNSDGIKANIKALIKNTEEFQGLTEKNPELKVGNLINASLNSKEIYEKGGFFSANAGILPSMVKILEKLEKESKKLSKEADKKKKVDCEKACQEHLKSFQEENNKLKSKTSEFLKCLEAAGNIELNKK